MGGVIQTRVLRLKELLRNQASPGLADAKNPKILRAKGIKGNGPPNNVINKPDQQASKV